MSASFHWIAWKSPMRLTELLALLRVAARDVERRLGDADRLRRDPDPAAVEGGHRDTESAALLVQEAVTPHPGALDHDVRGRRRVEAELLLLARDAHVVGVEDEARHAARARRRRVGAREEHERAGARSVRDPLLGTVQHPPVAIRNRSRSQRARVGAGAGLGERERPELLATRKRWHEPLALLVRAEREDRQRRRARVDRHRHPHTRIRARELLEHEDVGEEVRAGAAVLLGHAHAHEPELRELRQELVGEAMLAVPAGCVRGDLGLGQLAGQRLDRRAGRQSARSASRQF